MAKAKDTGAAQTYARALLDLATQQNAAEPAGQELTDLSSVIRADPAFGAFLRDPRVGVARRWASVDKTLGSQVSRLVRNFLGVLSQHDRLGLLPEIATAYHKLLDEQIGRVEVTVTVAQQLDEGALADVAARVGQALQKEAVVRQVVDESIIGGLIVRVEDKLIDASVRHQLESLRRQLRAGPRRPKPLAV